MIILLFVLTISLTPGGNEPQNYYPNYAAAREASKNMQKELVVFFTGSNCNTCESAWSVFSKDTRSTQDYVYTRLDIRDFDGGVFFDHFQFKQIPAWVILTPGAEVKEKWEGGWKNSEGSSATHDLSEGQFIQNNETNLNSGPKVPVQATTKPSSPNLKESYQKSSTESSNKKITPIPETIPESTISSFILQAGYFGSELNALKMISDLKTKGFADFRIEPVQKDGATYYRVISKVYNKESDLKIDQGRLADAGIKTSIKNNTPTATVSSE